MRIAYTYKYLSLSVIFVMLTGCSIAERLIPALSHTNKSPAMTTPLDAEVYEVGADWQSSYLLKISGLPKEVLLGELQFNQANFERMPSEANRTKLILTVMAAGQAREYKNIPSLLGDGDDGLGELSEEWRFFIKAYMDSLKEYNLLLIEKEQLVSDRRQYERSNDRLKSQLSTEESERQRLESQLKELKSIEKSLIQRDIREDASEP